MPRAPEFDTALVRLVRNTIYSPSPYSDEQLGLVYVATAARKKGFTVTILDDAIVTHARIRELVERNGVRVVGFYVDHENIFAAFSAMRRLREDCPHVALVTGGPQSKEWHRRILAETPCDVAVRGEGEVPFPAILAYFIRGEGDLAEIAGITWRRNDVIVVNPDAQPINLDETPVPDRTLNPLRVHPRGAETIVTGRGCPFRCSFCYEGRPEAKYRPRSMDNVMAEVEHLIVDRRVRYLVVLDDVFLLNPKRAIEFAKRLTALRKKHKWDMVWFCEARADIIAKRPDMMEPCVESGLIRVQVGVETGNQRVLDLYNKSLSVDETLRGVEICAKYDVLSIIGNFIVGGADETWETVEDSINFAKQLLDVAPGRIDVNSTLFTPYPGTPMYQRPELYGMKVLDQDCVTGPGDNYPFHETSGLSKWQLVEARQRFTHAVDEKMTQILGSIPVSLGRRHFEAYSRYYLRTRWFDFFCRHFAWYNYLGLPVSNEDIRCLDQMVDAQIWDWKPLRTVYLGTTLDGKFIVNPGHRKVELSEDASAFYELCAGKISLREISQRLQGKGYSLNDDHLLGLVQSFDQDRLLVFSAM